jgi:hypothetical protein
MPPSAADINSSDKQIKSTGGAVATPDGSLNVTGGTIIDRLSLLSTNAAALKAACP